MNITLIAWLYCRYIELVAQLVHGEFDGISTITGHHLVEVGIRINVLSLLLLLLLLYISIEPLITGIYVLRMNVLL